MKTFLNLITAMMLVLFMSACGSSGGSSGDGDNPGGGGDNPGGTYEKTGTYNSVFNSDSPKVWYTSKATSPDGVVVNLANYTRNGDTLTIMVGAVSDYASLNSDGKLAFTFSFPSGVTTGSIAGTSVFYKDNNDAIQYWTMDGIVGDGYTINVTEATDNGTVVHVKGTFSTTIYDGMDSNGNLKDPQSISVDFVFDADDLS